jgi:CPA2 family monovalent cation:H+ antiporter-2
LIALGAAFVTDYMGLSLALGAFVAGLLVAETEFQLQAEESIAPFKALLLGLFFMTVGMSINIHMIIEKIALIAALSFAIIIVKALIITLLSIAFRFSVGSAIHTGLLLAQGGEFAFVLFRLAKSKGIIDDNNGQILLLVVTITMAVTPLLANIGKYIADKIDNLNKSTVQEKLEKEIGDLNNHVIILGFGRVGEMVAKILEAENVNYIAVDMDSELVMEQRKKGYPIYLGDAAGVEMLRSIGISRASSVIIAMSNRITLMKAAKLINSLHPEIPIVARSPDLIKAQQYYDNGVNVIVPETYETGLQLGGAVLKSIGISEFEVSRIKNQFRAGNYVRLPRSEEGENV